MMMIIIIIIIIIIIQFISRHVQSYKGAVDIHLYRTW